jgi:TolB-like protein
VDQLEQLQAALADRYRIERELGRGGMATVYLAADLRHGRSVALKVLRPEIAPTLGAERFDREIAIAARLQHPHILGLFESGVTRGMLWYTMPYVEGETLRARLQREVQLDASEAVRVVCEVADALTYAHAAGVIHRDIKPENILLTAGHAVVADFGIAHAIDAAGGERLTETGLALGTPQYMSPEQASGTRAVDARSDVYALGCVLYEMLAGEPPFSGPTAQAVLARHALDPVPSLRTVRASITPALEAVIVKALAKVPADRFPSALEFKEGLARALREPLATAPARTRRPRRPALPVALLLVVVLLAAAGAAARHAGWGISRGPASPEGAIRSIAVQQFDNLTGDSAQIYLAQGITDQIETELAQIGSLRVLGLEGAAGSASAIETASRLGMEAVLSGSLQRAGDMVRISARLHSVEDGQALWARSFDGSLAAILQLQADVAQSVAERIRVSLAERSRMAGGRRQVTPAAYEAYVRGQYFRGKGTEAGFRTAIGYFRRAIDADPTYARAYSGLANCYVNLGYYGAVEPDEAFPQARAAARRALELDSTLADAHLAVAHELFYGAWSFPDAEREFDRAAELGATDAQIHWLRGMYLTAMNRPDEAIASVERAQQLDPLSIVIQAASARSYYNARRYEDAIRQARAALELDSTFARARFWIGMSYEQLSRPQDAIRELKLTIALGGPTSIYLAAVGHMYGTIGRRDEAIRVLRQLELRGKSRYVSALDIATVHLGLGDTEAVFTWLERALETRASALVYLAVDPRYDAIRGDPRFADILRRVGFPPTAISGPRGAVSVGAPAAGRTLAGK